MYWEQRHLWVENFGHYIIWFCTIMYNNLTIKMQIIVGRTLPKFQKIRSTVTNVISRLHWRKHTYSNLGTNMLDKIFRQKWKNQANFDSNENNTDNCFCVIFDRNLQSVEGRLGLKLFDFSWENLHIKLFKNRYQAPFCLCRMKPVPIQLPNKMSKTVGLSVKTCRNLERESYHKNGIAWWKFIFYK